jgi:hypothetical protein
MKSSQTPARQLEILAEVTANMELFQKVIAFEKGDSFPKRYAAIGMLIEVHGIGRSAATKGVNLLWESVDPDYVKVDFPLNDELESLSASILGCKVSRESNHVSILKNNLLTIQERISKLLANCDKVISRGTETNEAN